MKGFLVGDEIASERDILGCVFMFLVFGYLDDLVIFRPFFLLLCNFKTAGFY